jgi:hypothetical protein
MLRCHISALSADNLLHFDPYTNVSSIQPNLHIVPYPVASPRFPRLTISNFQNFDYVHRIGMQSDVVGFVDECCMMVVIPTDSRCVLTTPSMTRMPSLTNILLVNFVFNIDCVLSLNCRRHDDIMVIDCQSTWFGVWNIRVAHMTLAHAQTNYRVSQFGH